MEEPATDDSEPETLRARLIAYAVEPVAQRRLVEILPDGDERATSVKHDLDELAHAREVGEWPRAEDSARRLLQWIVLDRGSPRA